MSERARGQGDLRGCNYFRNVKYYLGGGYSGEQGWAGLMLKGGGFFSFLMFCVWGGGGKKHNILVHGFDPCFSFFRRRARGALFFFLFLSFFFGTVGKALCSNLW